MYGLSLLQSLLGAGLDLFFQHLRGLGAGFRVMAQFLAVRITNRRRRFISESISPYLASMRWRLTAILGKAKHGIQSVHNSSMKEAGKY